MGLALVRFDALRENFKNWKWIIYVEIFAIINSIAFICVSNLINLSSNISTLWVVSFFILLVVYIGVFGYCFEKQKMIFSKKNYKFYIFFVLNIIGALVPIVIFKEIAVIIVQIIVALMIYVSTILFLLLQRHKMDTKKEQRAFEKTEGKSNDIKLNKIANVEKACLLLGFNTFIIGAFYISLLILSKIMIIDVAISFAISTLLGLIVIYVNIQKNISAYSFLKDKIKYSVLESFFFVLAFTDIMYFEYFVHRGENVFNFFSFLIFAVFVVVALSRNKKISDEYLKYKAKKEQDNQ
ncbi:MAG: hypothetical protein LBT30_08120 [Clostridiales bacterium]|jgi:hypothetical protein|nr:hypothetical protein [Clostridiales bacterium]